MSFWGRKEEKEEKDITKIFFATDVHGSERCFTKFVNAGKFYDVNALILGGDLTGKMIIPIIEQPDGTYITGFMEQQRAITKEELPAMEKTIRNSGCYPYVTDKKGYEMLEDPATRGRLFEQLATEVLERWMKFAEERLEDTGTKIYITAGNDDPFCIDQILRSSDYIVYSEGRVVNIDENHEMINTGYSNISPWNCPRDIPDDELLRKIEKMASQVKNMRNCIFNLHCPPKDSGLDTCPMLDATSSPPKPIMKAGQLEMYGGGSTAVRSAIEKYQPLLGLHGHIHESRGSYKLGRVLCLNPGSEYGEGVLRGAMITLDEKGVKHFQLTSG